MADKSNVVLGIKIDGVEMSLKSVKDLKTAVKALQDEVENSDIGSEQYKNAVEQLDALNEKLKEVTRTEKQNAEATEAMAKAEKEATKETQDLRKQFEILEDELFLLAGQGKQNTKEFKDLTVQAAALNKKIDEVNQSLGGNETERAAIGMAKLNEGFKNLDFKSVKEGFSIMRTAIAAVGIGLLVQLVSYLYENFDRLSKGSGALAVALRLVGDYVQFVLGTLMKLANAITDFIGLTSESQRAIEAQGEAIVDTSKKTKTALEDQVKGFDNQIAAAKAAGKNTVVLEKEKQDAIIETNKKINEQIIAFVKSGGQLTEEQKKLFDENIKSIKEAVQAKKIIDITDKKEELDRANKHKEDMLKIQQEEADAWWAERLAEQEQYKKEDEAAKKAEQDELDRLARIGIAQDEQMKRFTDQSNEREKRKIEEIEKEKQLEKDKVNATLEIAKVSNQSLQQLSDAYFYFKTKNLQKGSDAELKAAQQQFKINKALAITSAVISGIQGVVNALSAQSVIPEPFGTILKAATAVGVGIATAVNVAKIASTQFNPGSTSAPSSSATTSVPIPAPPTINTPSANTNSSTSFDETGKKVSDTEKTNTPIINVKSTVSVEEINKKQNRVEVLEKQSTF